MAVTLEDLPALYRLIDEGWDLDAAERERWLSTLPPEHERLKQTLNEMLSQRGGVETDIFVKPLGRATAAWTEGSDVGGYRLIREIGVGGMGAVWLAEPSDGVLKRRVALKLPLFAIHNKSLAERFDRERDILASLTHPNIARLYDAGTTPTGQPYMALEYVEGLTITAHCDAQKLSIRERIALFSQVLAAVQYAHSNLVLHRDLKPSNVLVTPDGQVKLLDFGIAKLISAGDVPAEASALTQVGGQALTPDYASPEQISGAALTTASDVYSLSVLLYEMLAGERPYKLKVRGRAAIEEAIAHTEPVKASQMIRAASDLADRAEARRTTATKFAKLLMGDLDTILAKALKKSPSARYATASAFAADLQHYLTGDVVQAQPDSRWYRLRKLVGRNRLVVGATALVMASLFSGAAVALWQASVATNNLQLANIASARAQTEARRAESQAERANTEATRADAASKRAMLLLRQAQGETTRANQLATAEAISAKAARDAQSEALTQASRAEREKARALEQLDLAEAMGRLTAVALGPVSDKPLSVADVLRRGEAMAEKQFDQTPRVHAYLQTQLASLWGSGGQWNQMEALLSKARTSAQRAGDVVGIAIADCYASVPKMQRGEFVSARALIDSAIANLRTSHPGLTDPIVTCLRHRAMLLGEQGQPDAALADTDEAIALIADQRIDQSGVLLNLRETRAGALAALGRLAPAVRDYEAVLAEFQRRGELDSTTNSFKLNNFAVILQRAGQSRRALQTIEQSLPAWQGANADREMDLAQRANYISALHSVGRLDQALPQIELGMKEVLRNNEPRMLSQMSLRAAEVLCETSELPRCDSLISMSAKNFAAYMKPDHPTMARLNLLQARLALIRRAPRTAREHVLLALAVMDKEGRVDGRRVIALGQLAEADLMTGERDAALKHAEEATAYSRKHFADFPTSRWGGLAKLSLGRVHRDRGEQKLAVDALQNAKTELTAALGADSPLTMTVTLELSQLLAAK